MTPPLSEEPVDAEEDREVLSLPRRFTVGRKLGSGTMGVVWEARDHERDETVALKMLRIPEGELLFRFKREFRAVADVRHPNLVRLYELFDAGGRWFFSMEYLEGRDFVSAVAGPKGSPVRFDEGRLRPAFGQLCEGLAALHERGIVHRDVKSSNVLVVGERVVVLDFGVSALLSEEDTGFGPVVGTPLYMSPEQARGEPATAAADAYSVGVLLFRALTGRFPFEGKGTEVMAQKQFALPRPPSTESAGIPPDLDGLCVDLLDPEPERRPVMEALIARLSRTTPGASTRSTRAWRPVEPFVGRVPELTALVARYDQTTETRETRVVVLEGASGVGKSALGKRFAATLTSRGDDAPLVFYGRCYERERVAYNGVDAIVDGISEWLSRVAAVDEPLDLPADIALVARLFPILRRLDAVANAAPPTVAGDIDVRRRAFEGFRDLVGAIAARRRVVLLLDDIQWADGDALALLSALVHPPGAPPIFVLLTLRTKPDEPLVLDRVVETLACSPSVLHVGELDPEDARLLAYELLSQRTEGGRPSSEAAPALAREAKGHPLFLRELVQSFTEGAALSNLPRLEEAFNGRLARLDPKARDLLDVLAVAAAPLAPGLAAAAAGMTMGQLVRAEDELREANFVSVRPRGSQGRGSSRPPQASATDAKILECYHDRVREVVVGKMSPETLRSLHARLAEELSSDETGTLSAAVVLHLERAGRPEEAARRALREAAAAFEALAFGNAADLWEVALRLGHLSEAEERAVRDRLGDALVNLGRGAEAARSFLKAAQGAGSDEVLELRRKAAEQFLRSGHIDEGIALSRTVLESVGLSLAKSPATAVARVLWCRFRLWLRGLRFRQREEASVPRDRLRAIDVCWSVSVGLSIADNVRSSDVNSRGLLLALAAGEPGRIMRALVMEIGFLSTPGTRARSRRAEAVKRMASTLAERIGTPYAMGLLRGATGLTAFLQGRWPDCNRLLSDANSVFRKECTGVAWESTTTELFLLASCLYIGEVARVRSRVRAALDEAVARGDLFAQTNLRIRLMSFLFLVDDDPESAVKEISSAISFWSNAEYHIEHYYRLWAIGHVHLYTGEPARTLEACDDEMPKLRKTKQLTVQETRLEVTYLRARAEVAVGTPETLNRAREDVKAMRNESATWATGLIELIEAGIDARRGDRAGADAHLVNAASALDGADMKLYADVARVQRGKLAAMPGAQEAARGAEKALRARGVLNLERFCRMLSPGFEP
jgi:hypothetical protein